MGILFIIAAIALIAIFTSSGSSGYDSRSEQQRWADEFEMDSYDDEQYWGDD